MKKSTAELKAAGMLAIALALGMMVIGCDTDPGDPGNNEPVNVDKSLPAIETVSNYTGTFVTSESEATDLIVDALDALEDLDFSGVSLNIKPASLRVSGNNVRPAIRSAARATLRDSWTETFVNEQIADGVYANGYCQESYVVFAKNARDEEDIWDGYYADAVGDYEEESFKVKFSIDFGKQIQPSHSSVTIYGGKYVFDEDEYFKGTLRSLSPQRFDIIERVSASNGYALSVSKNGKGLKFVMKLEAKIDVSLSNKTWDEIYAYFDNADLDDILTYLFTVDVYDNSNVKQYSKSFTDPEDANDYLGTELFDW